MIRVFANLEALSSAAAEHIVSHAERCIGQRGAFTMLLAGGSTPEVTYRILATESYAKRGIWSRTHIYWGDERCVPPQSPQSNYRMAKEALIDPLGLPADRVHRMEAERQDRDPAADEYAAILPSAPDLVLLGMGADGHTASLFPHSPALRERTRRVIPVEAPAEPRCRFTVTPPVLASAVRVLVLVSGQGKAEALERVFLPEGSIEDTPARLVREGVWFVDRAAADRTMRLDLGDLRQVQTG